MIIEISSILSIPKTLCKILQYQIKTVLDHISRNNHKYNDNCDFTYNYDDSERKCGPPQEGGSWR